MEKIGLIIVILGLTLMSYFALSKPVAVVRMMHGLRSFWIKLSGNNVITYEQSSMRELAEKDPQGYERKYPAQVSIVRWMGIISLLILIASICMLFN